MKVLVTFSGGKDSLASLLWVREHITKNRYRDDPRNRILTAEEARSLIEKHRMVKVCENKEGVVWTIG